MQWRRVKHEVSSYSPPMLTIEKDIHLIGAVKVKLMKKVKISLRLEAASVPTNTLIIYEWVFKEKDSIRPSGRFLWENPQNDWILLQWLKSRCYCESVAKRGLGAMPPDRLGERQLHQGQSTAHQIRGRALSDSRMAWLTTGKHLILLLIDLASAESSRSLPG